MDIRQREEEEFSFYTKSTNAFKTLVDKVYMHRFPSYGNTIFYSLGFMALTSLVMLAVTGITMAFMGQSWWLYNPLGEYFRSVHLWSVQAFLAVLVLHITVVFLTSGFKPPRRMVWVFGAGIFCLALIQTEFGYGLRGDFSSQFRASSGADFWNGSYLGHLINPLSFSQSFALHVAIIPGIIFALFVMHYLLEHTYGVAKPYRADINYTMVDANHVTLFIRGAVLVAAIAVLAFFFPSPYVVPLTIADIATQNPALVASTLQQEYDRTSGTATYLDSIDPYAYDTRQVYVVAPYEQYMGAALNPASTTDSAAMIQTLLPLAQSGLYEAMVSQENPALNDTYVVRFLNDLPAGDTDVLEAKAATLNMSTAEWGMAKDETGRIFGLPPGSWWFLPLAFTNSAFNLLQNPNGDRDAAEILGGVMLIFILFPYIPYLNRLPELLHVAPFIWKDRRKDKN